jgi:hypothetical protein
MALAGFELAVPACKRLQTHALDHVATGSAIREVPVSNFKPDAQFSEDLVVILSPST